MQKKKSNTIDIKQRNNDFNTTTTNDEEEKNFKRKAAFLSNTFQDFSSNREKPPELSLDESLVGQVLSSEQFEGPMEREFAYDLVSDIIAAVPDWKQTGDSFGMASVRGSNSLIQNVIGHAEWRHFAFGR